MVPSPSSSTRSQSPIGLGGLRRLRLAVPVSVLLFGGGLQAQVILGNENLSVLGTLEICGGPCSILSVDSLEVLIGEGAGIGAGEDVDLSVVDADSLSTAPDRSLTFNATLADLTLGSGSMLTAADAGDLLLGNGQGVILLDLDGLSGNINQDVDNINLLNGNGVVKGWAKINSDGSIASCWKCNSDAAETQRLGTGQYEVDFTVGDLSQRPCLVSPGDHGVTGGTVRIVDCYHSTDPSSKNVESSDASGTGADADFTILIF